MNNNREPFSPVHLVKHLREHTWHWLAPALVIGSLGVLYAAVRSDTWAASQALIVRNEAASHREGNGQFDHADQMKTLQETILEVARSRDVLRAALQEAGPPDDYTESVPAFLTVIMMPLTYNITEGIAFGFISYALLKLLSGRGKEVNAFIYVFAALFVIRYILNVG